MQMRIYDDKYFIYKINVGYKLQFVENIILHMKVFNTFIKVKLIRAQGECLGTESR